MNTAFRETRNFTDVIAEYFGGDVAYFRLQDVLGENPEQGVVMRGTGGLRKMRWPDPRRGKGKRDGLRVIYLYLPMARLIVFLDVYDKDEADDLSTDDKKTFAALWRNHLNMGQP